MLGPEALEGAGAGIDCVAAVEHDGDGLSAEGGDGIGCNESWVVAVASCAVFVEEPVG